MFAFVFSKPHSKKEKIFYIMQEKNSEYSKSSARVLKYIELKNISKRDFYIKTGLSNGYLDKTSNIGSDKVEKIVSAYPDINVNWLVTGHGNMLVSKDYADSEDFTTIKEPRSVYETKRLGIPLIPISATAGFSSMDVQILEHDVEEYFNIPFLSEKPDFAIGINGDSMSPLYEDKSFIICKKIPVSEMVWEGVYLITVNGSSMVKRIYPSITPGCILCRSDNQRYRDFDILKADITSIAKILSSIRIN
ncbi:MAG: helix-turn-helix transcriptional regulator [Candidatus Methylacidiphilales bacterium]